MSQVYLKDFVIEAKHGVHDHEKINSQRFKIHIELEVDTPKAYQTDTVENTVSYSDIRKTVIHIFQSNTFDLIEHLAQVIVDTLLENKLIQRVTISIEKLDVYPDAIPGIRFTQSQN